MRVREVLQGAIRPSTTRATRALWAKSLLNAVLFFAVFMVVLPGFSTVSSRASPRAPSSSEPGWQAVALSQGWARGSPVSMRSAGMAEVRRCRWTRRGSS